VQNYPIGPGMVAERVFACDVRVRPAVACTLLGWRPQGFVFGARNDLAYALTFSGDGRGRVIASTDRDVIYSDDRGQHWQTAVWNGVVRPQVIAMEPRAGFGVALAEGAIHLSEDGGISWRFTRELASRRLLQAVVLGRNALVADGTGGLWAIVQGGEFRVLSDGSGSTPGATPLPEIHVAGSAIVATGSDGSVTRLTVDGAIERSSPSPWWGR
jgi:hypothetical protein